MTDFTKVKFHEEPVSSFLCSIADQSMRDALDREWADAVRKEQVAFAEVLAFYLSECNALMDDLSYNDYLTWRESHGQKT